MGDRFESDRVDGLDLEVAFVVAGHQIVLVQDVGDEAAVRGNRFANRLAGVVELVGRVTSVPGQLRSAHICRGRSGDGAWRLPASSF